MNTYKIEKNVAPFKGTEVPMLSVADAENKVVFKMPVRWQLVFAITSCDKLWLLEETPHGTFSVEADLTSGKARSFKMSGTEVSNSRTFQYVSTNGQDSWKTIE